METCMYYTGAREALHESEKDAVLLRLFLISTRVAGNVRNLNPCYGHITAEATDGSETLQELLTWPDIYRWHNINQ